MAFKRFRAVLVAACVVGAVPAGCQQAKPEDRPDVAMYDATDAAMEAAKARGRSTLPEFFRHLESPAADEQDFSVKFNLTPDADAEFIWANDLRLGSDGTLTGALANHPIDGRYKLGQRVSIARAEIIDWSYFKGSVAQGHHTTRVMLDQAPPDQAAEIRASLGW